MLVTRFVAAAVMAAAAMPVTMYADGFTIKGALDGLPDSTKVTITDIEDPNGKVVTLAEGSASGGAFELNASTAAPRMCELNFSRYNEKQQRFQRFLTVPVMVENRTYSFKSALNLDSLLNLRYPSYMIQVSGGQAQEQFNNYREYTRDAYTAAQDASYLNTSKYFESNDNRDTMIKYDALKKAAEANLAAYRNRFIALHPDYNISAYLTQKELETQFVYTADEINAMAELVKACPDTARVSTVDRRRNFALKYALGRQNPDFAITSADGNVAQISSHIAPGKYNFIDFWASWCGPCRSAIPHVKELQSKYADKLNILSVSLDEDEAEWRKAMDEEKMNWVQLRAAGDQMNDVAQAYFITAIPRLIVIDEKGNVVCSTNRPDEVTDFLKNNLGE